MEELIAIQNELKAPKSQENKFGNYNYRSCEDILEAAKPLLKKHECELTLSDEVVTVGGRFYVKVTAEIRSKNDKRQVTAYARETENKKGMDDSQITGAASSYARKYALNGLFLIDDTKDSDTDEYCSQPNNAKESKQEKTPVEFYCSVCGRKIKNVQKKSGELVTAQHVYESCGKKCPDCYKKEAANG